MVYQILIKPRARRDIEKLPRAAGERIAGVIDTLANDPRPLGVKNLQAEANLWRVRVGNYRIIHEIHDKQLIVLIVRVADSKDVYR